jgi:DNA invertase Pin-like site-specific DNA recombinase
MINDIEAKRINMVIVKDLSRFGRDYIYTGYYLDVYFKKNNIRFISILDNIDSNTNDNNYDFIPFKSIINDMYSKDNSKKIRSALHIKQLSGKWVGACPPFGYMVDKSDKNHLVINKSEANIVKKIFSLYLNGNTLNMISNYLYNKKIMTPNIIRNINKKYKYCNYGYWSTTTIKSILTNPLYTGDMVQNRRSKINYKIKKIKNNEKGKWIIVPNTHDAIITKKDFNKIQEIINSKRKIIINGKKNDYLLCGLINCYECGKRMILQKNKDYYYLVCNTYKKNSKLNICTSHCMNYYSIEKMIIEKIKSIISNHNYTYIINKIEKNIYSKKEEKIKRINDILNKLYIDKLEENICEETYKELNLKYRQELLNINRENKLKDVSSYFNNITKDIIFRLINKIYIHKDKTIDVYFNFIASK